MEYLRETVDSSSLTGLFDLPTGLRNRIVEVIILPAENRDDGKPRRKSARGRFSKYANPSLIPMEKEAWARAAEDKHADR